MMTTPIIDFPKILLLARLVDAAYEPDTSKQKSAFNSFGAEWTGCWSNAQASVTVGSLNGRQIIVIPGTHFSQHTKPLEILDDLRGDGISLGYGKVFDGDYTPFVPVWRQVQKAANIASSPLVIGHSLGGARALISPCVDMPAEAEIISIGAPPAANKQFWRAIYPPGRRSPLVMINDGDFAPCFGIDRLEGWDQPLGPYLVLRNGMPGFEDAVPFGLSIDAHLTSTGYIPALEAVCAKESIL